MRKLVGVMTLFGAVVLGTACAVLQDPVYQPIARAAIQLGVHNFVEGDPGKIERVREVVEQARSFFDQGDTTVSLVGTAIRAVIHWEKLNEQEVVLVNALIDTVEAVIAQEVGEGTLDPETTLAVNTILDWILEVV